jgi:hypothetical protein
LSYNTCVYGSARRKLPVAISDKQKCHPLFFYKIGEHEGRTNPDWVWYQWEGGGGGKKSHEGEYGANTVYTCM